jgi:hypothetical protein
LPAGSPASTTKTDGRRAFLRRVGGLQQEARDGQVAHLVHGHLLDQVCTDVGRVSGERRVQPFGARDWDARLGTHAQFEVVAEQRFERRAVTILERLEQARLLVQKELDQPRNGDHARANGLRPASCRRESQQCRSCQYESASTPRHRRSSMENRDSPAATVAVRERAAFSRTGRNSRCWH